eukprot:314099_1
MLQTSIIIIFYILWVYMVKIHMCQGGIFRNRYIGSVGPPPKHLLVPPLEDPYCIYNADKLEMACGGVTCKTSKANVKGTKGRTEPGLYRAGKFYVHPKYKKGWFNLYPLRFSSGTSYWDYYTNAPNRKCRSKMALHEGTRSDGCITVINEKCWDNLRKKVEAQTYASRPIYKCRGCGYIGNCLFTHGAGNKQLGPLVKVIRTTNKKANLEYQDIYGNSNSHQLAAYMMDKTQRKKIETDLWEKAIEDYYDVYNEYYDDLYYDEYGD